MPVVFLSSVFVFGGLQLPSASASVVRPFPRRFRARRALLRVRVLTTAQRRPELSLHFARFWASFALLARQPCLENARRGSVLSACISDSNHRPRHALLEVCSLETSKRGGDRLPPSFPSTRDIFRGAKVNKLSKWNMRPPLHLRCQRWIQIRCRAYRMR